ncbi:uncharacterized protein Z520_00095 [Fonsecaea multimorphosa CBS 102226]|uniref:Xylanolytic transcriptional activator regulatory domain-containing protein n=1 Tax=Fonsecaea multimorphosa CBS 102226 TaxID=1442371 RepID=A0A0D2L311_9EURO|nr:uncharacterized protein Z520_00095 [Fonsecaea multimorphosa CBS 102226]KIY03404.1 hypothetical protein Z520_00095 [Fonsecaea multimorphosa CBS 102226]
MGILRSLRSGADVSTALKSVEATTPQIPDIFEQRLEKVYDIPQSKEPPAVLSLYGLLQPFDQATSSPSSSGRNSVQWTTVIKDPEIISYLLDLYFTYHHPLCLVIPEPLIRADMASGRTRHCSPVLINAILAVACTFLGLQDDVKSANDLWPSVEDFFIEAERLLAEHPEPSLTAVAALCLLAVVENLHLRCQRARKLSGRAICMALFLGLPLGRTSDEEQTEATADDRALIVVQQQLFWVCYQVDQMASNNAGCAPQIIIDDLGIRLPNIDDIAATGPWDPSSMLVPFSDFRDRSSCWFYLAELAKVVSTTMSPPRALVHSRKNRDIRLWELSYQAWYRRLPASFAVSDTAPGHVIAIHMWYHGCLIQSFRQVAAPGRGDLSVTALQICQNAAKEITDLFSCYRSRYGLRGINAMMCQALLDAYSVHLSCFPSAIKDLLTVVEAFQDVSKRQQWARTWLKRLESQTLHSPVAESAAIVEALFGRHENTSEEGPTVQECSSEKPLVVNRTNATTNIDLIPNAASPEAQNAALAATTRPHRWNDDYFFSPFVRH